MRLESKNAQVTLVWDEDKMFDLIIRSENGQILMVQTQGKGVSTTNIHQPEGWDGVFK